MSKNIVCDNRIKNCLAVSEAITETFFEKVAPQLRSQRIFIQKEKNRLLDNMGVDALLVQNGQITYTDIKAHAIGTNSPRPNYAFELAYTQRYIADNEIVTERKDGWFVSERKVTQKYLFIFWTGLPSAVSSMRVVVIDKRKLIQKLQDLGVNISKWRDSIERPNRSVYGKNYFFPITDDHRVRYVQSVNLPEQPVNIVVEWPLLTDIVDYENEFNLSPEANTAS